jgi:hypothetical protein
LIEQETKGATNRQLNGPGVQLLARQPLVAAPIMSPNTGLISCDSLSSANR